MLPSFLTSTMRAPASALGLIEGIADGLAGAARLVGGALADEPDRRRSVAVGGYATTAVLSGLIGAAGSVWQVAVLRAGAWTARGLRVPARNALLADVVPATVYGRAYGFERAMDNLGAIGGPLLAIALVGLIGVRSAILLSIIPGLLAALAIVYAIRHTPAPTVREHQPIRLRVRPLLHGRLGRLLAASAAFETGNLAARASSRETASQPYVEVAAASRPFSRFTRCLIAVGHQCSVSDSSGRRPRAAGYSLAVAEECGGESDPDR